MLVLEASDLPEAIADGEDVTIKVAVGTREFQTAPNRALGGKTTPWSLDFEFPVLNLRDNLLVMLLDKNGEIISKNEIDAPSIVEKGSFEVDLVLNGGGNIHLSLSFVLTDEERRRIDVMRAAALKRREQQALKSAASTQPVEEESEIGPSNPTSPSIGELEKDVENFEGSKESPAASKESDELQPNKSEENLQDTHQEPSKGLEPVGDLDTVGQISSEESDEPLPNKSEENLEATYQEPSIGLEPVGELDSVGQISSGRSVSPQNPAMNSQTLADTNNMLDEHIAPDEAPEDPSEVNHVTPSPNSVKARIKAFETSKRKGAIKQVSYTLPSTVEVCVSSPQLKGSPKRYVESEAERAELPEAHLDHKGVKGAGDENSDLANQMGSRESSQSLSEGNVAASRASRAEPYQKEEEETEIKGIESNVEPIPNMDRVGANERDMQGEKPLAEASKLKRSNIDLRDVSKQVLNGAIIGAISGAVLVAAGALLWARNPNKRRHTRARQLSKQEMRK